MPGKFFKVALFAVTALLAAPIGGESARATPIATQTIGFDEGLISLDAKNGSDSHSFITSAPDDSVIHGTVQIDLKHIEYWWRRRPGQSNAKAREEQALSWNFSLNHAGKTVDLGGLPGAVDNAWLKTDLFDGVVAGGKWLLTASSDYHSSDKRMINFELAGFFKVKQGGSVPAPGGLALMFAGLGGVVAARRRRRKA